MKYYLITIQYNKEVHAENRPVPKVYDDFDKAQADFYEQVGKDMKNAVLGGSLNMVINEVGGTYSDLTKSWGIMSEPVIIEEDVIDPNEDTVKLNEDVIDPNEDTVKLNEDITEEEE